MRIKQIYASIYFYDSIYCPKSGKLVRINENHKVLTFETLLDLQVFLSLNEDCFCSKVDIVYDNLPFYCISGTVNCDLPFFDNLPCDGRDIDE